MPSPSPNLGVGRPLAVDAIYALAAIDVSSLYRPQKTPDAARDGGYRLGICQWASRSA